MIPGYDEPIEHRWICTGDECGETFWAPGITATCPACESRAIMDTGPDEDDDAPPEERSPAPWKCDWCGIRTGEYHRPGCPDGSVP